ncbi:MAG: hypothetical protein V4857_02515 [Pseudomonadota bacterium]
MALISCPECKAQVSDTALKCTQCGVQLRKATRSFFGKLIKWSFVGFNLLMAFWLWAGMSAATKSIDAASSGAEQAGAAIGTGIGAALIIGAWLVGAVILGLFVLFTRPKS